MVVISDASVLVSLNYLNILPVLQKLYQQVIIPQAVFSEMVDAEIFLHDTIKTKFSFIHIYTINGNEEARQLETILDKGEAEAIVAYKECNADCLLIDELTGRNVAEKMGLKIKGTLGVLLEAKNSNEIVAIKPLIEILTNKLKFRISEELKQFVLQKANEL